MRRLLLLLTLVSSLSFAYDPCKDPTFDLCYSACCGAFEGGGELLYMHPTVCDLNFLVEDDREASELDADSLPFGSQRALNPSYQFGFRLWVGYLFEDGRNDVRAQYSTVHRTDTSRIRPPGQLVIWPTFGHPALLNLPLWTNGDIVAESTGRSRLDYDAFDAHFGQWWRPCCGQVQLRTFAGLQFVNIERHHDACYRGFSDQMPEGEGQFEATYDTKRKVWSVGPHGGAEAIYNLWCGFGLGGRFATGILAGRTWADHQLEAAQEVKSKEEPVVTNMKIHENSHCALMPMINLRGGINYTWYCEDAFLLVAEFGYEFLHYINALDTLVFNYSEGTAKITTESFGLHGFYLSARLQF